MLTPTPEQQAAIEAFSQRRTLVIEAGAGTGKTSTLKLLATERSKEHGIYLAFNRTIADSARASFPDNVKCGTAHSFAYQAVGRFYRHRLDAHPVRSRELATILGLSAPMRHEKLVLEPFQLARLVMNTVNQFCTTTDQEVTVRHIDYPLLVADNADAQAAAAEIVLPHAKRAWLDLQEPNSRLPFTHDHYLKMWQLDSPTLRCDFLLFDEAQDADPVIADVVDHQDHAQRVYVGDSAQAIYGWRGAVDAMSQIRDAQRLRLTQSFRFGPVIAAEANKWLAALNSEMRLTGLQGASSRLTTLSTPNAVLCRSNSGCLDELIDSLNAGIRTALAGGSRDLQSVAQAANNLAHGRRSDHKMFAGFSSWQELREYVENDHPDQQLKRWVQLVEKHGAETLLRAFKKTVDQATGYPERTISTAHKAKGLEWPSVRIADDYFEPFERHGKMIPVTQEDAMLAYVAVTRARTALDRGGLAWIDKYLRQHGLSSRIEHTHHSLQLRQRVQPATPARIPPRPAEVTPAPASHHRPPDRAATLSGPERSKVPAPHVSTVHPAATKSSPPKRSWWRRILGLD